MSEDKEFIGGLYAKRTEKDFIKCQISIKKDQFTNWYKKQLENKEEQWINIDIKVNKDGKWYAEKNNWKPTPKKVASDKLEEEDIPF